MHKAMASSGPVLLGLSEMIWALLLLLIVIVAFWESGNGRTR